MEQNGEIFTYEATLTEGSTYFVFSSDFGSWDAINANRYGPTDANQEIAAGEEVTTQLSSNSNASYYISAQGDYVITFDRANLCFKFEAKGAGLKGDVDGSGIVDVDDVNEIINIILGY